MLSKDNISKWKNNGYCIADNIIPVNLLNECVNKIKQLYQDKELICRDFGSDGKLDFPTGICIDYVSLNENLLNCVQQLLGTKEILLCQCDTWCKKGSNVLTEQSNNDQRMHMDYGNNTFLHPSDWNNPESVAIIIYLSDVNETSGGTAVVPRIDDNDELYKSPYINMPGLCGDKFINNKKDAELYYKEKNIEVFDFRKKLYEREMRLVPKLGDILFYRLDVWHRGTPVNKGKVRFVMNLLFKKKECYWINQWNSGWTKKMYYGSIEELFVKLSPYQRSILGVPLPGDKYWDIEKINYLKYRYPNIDINPYLKEMQSKL